MERRADRRLPANDNARLTRALSIDRDCIGLQGLDNDAPCRLVLGLALAVRQCDDGILVFDGTRNLTHLIADEAWDLYCRLRDTYNYTAQGEIALPSDGSFQSADPVERAMLDALETAGLLRRC